MLAHDYEENLQLQPNRAPQRQPQRQPNQREVPARRRQVKKKRSFYNVKFLLSLTGFGVFAILFGQLYLDARLQQVHYQIEQKQRDITEITSRNEELYSEVSRLSSPTRIMSIAQERGLELTENIIRITIPSE